MKTLEIIVETKLDRTVEGLNKLASEFLMNAYQLTLDIPVKINGRLKKSYGQYVESCAGEPMRIDISKISVIYAHDKSLMNTLKHECIHYALKLLDLPNDDHHPYFEEELIKQDASRVCEEITVGKVYEYKCSKCENTYKLKKAMKNETEYFCQCNSKLELVNIYSADGFNIIQLFDLNDTLIKEETSDSEIVYQDIQIEGAIVEVFEKDNYIFLDSIIIENEYRNKGLATRIVKELINNALSQGKVIYCLASGLLGGNYDKLCKWYESLGFKKELGLASGEFDYNYVFKNN